jgi:hypothetical protein
MGDISLSILLRGEKSSTGGFLCEPVDIYFSVTFTSKARDVRQSLAKIGKLLLLHHRHSLEGPSGSLKLPNVALG